MNTKPTVTARDLLDPEFHKKVAEQVKWKIPRRVGRGTISTEEDKKTK